MLVRLTLAVWSLAMIGASCDKKTAADPGPQNIGPPETVSGPKKDVPGVELKGLSDDQKNAFHRLVDKVQSPCGKAQSLRVSIESDPTCKRAPFAARYLVRRLAEGEYSESEVADLFQARYRPEKTYQFELKETPFMGVPSAPVVMVEFFDYGCPHCKQFVPILEDVLAEFPSDVVLYIKHFPLSSNPDSVPAAMSAVAAQKQGKFQKMHHTLFAHQEEGHAKEALARYAQEAGLDMARFKADFEDAKTRAKVDADRAEGEKSDLKGTPTIYLNGHKWPEDEGMSKEEMIEWIREELAVNR
jgi:protein-disulfide isomerase